ncbi:uncharacterized protein LOC122645953 isoform X4 [Telopea speciosissima]|uniref:uncharacterized protein LOC122645953 isoform X4 n=1 Tax=Telopea speciosissima TaxID=54955 RepID=UPI001CC6FB63|nr:uncharacterized protein LOC122645953 isoform X4 [Telopea speciosissima]
MAETKGDFVDILLGFLTMPMGTIVRLISKQPQSAIIGSMTNLYKEVENLEEELLQTRACKSMLLHPRNPTENECKKLKLNIDDTEPTKYYICADWNCSRREIGGLYTTFKNVKCKCGKMMDKEIFVKKEDGGVFVYGLTKFMVTDDLQVEPMSPAATLTLLHKLGIKDMSSLQETTLSIGSEEIMNLLKGLLFSKIPLTDVLLRKKEFASDGLKFEIGDAVQSKSEGSPLDMTMKLTISKSMNKALYAEVGEDMGNFLLSFLTLPLGSILQLLGGNSSLGSMDNLYKSVECSKVTRADSLRDLLLHPGLYRGSYNPTGVNEIDLPDYLWCTSFKNTQNKDDDPYTVYLTTKGQSKRGRTGERHTKLLKSSTSETAGQGGFLKGPATFIVTDNLVFTPLVSMWTLAFLKSMKVTLDDLEVRMVSMDREKALRLLKASLVSKAVLTDVFLNFGLKTPKQESKP